MHVYIATPMYGGQCSGTYTHSLVCLLQAFAKSNIASSYQFLFNESLVTRARNTLAHGFLQSSATHLLFIDADMGFDAQDTLRILEAQKDVIVGLYPRKEINWPRVHAAATAGVPADQLAAHSGCLVLCPTVDSSAMLVDRDAPLEVAAGGTGFMLIARHVLERMASAVPQYISDVNEGSQTPAWHKAFFDTTIDPNSGQLLADDFAFCHRWRAMGGKIYAAPWARYTHVGHYAFTAVV